MEKMILRFQLEAAQQSIIYMEKELAEQKKLNDELQRTLKHKVPLISPSSSGSGQFYLTSLTHLHHEQEQKEKILGDSIREHEEAMVQLRRHMKDMEAQMLTLTDNAQMLKQLVLCQQCCKRLRNVVLLPCMHMLFCSKCIKEMKRQHKQEKANNRHHSQEDRDDEENAAHGGGRQQEGVDNGLPKKAKHQQQKKTTTKPETKARFGCPKCGIEVRGRMKCEMGA